MVTWPRNLLRLIEWHQLSMSLLHCSHCFPPFTCCLRVVKEITEEPNSKTAVDATGLKAQFDLQSSWHCLTNVIKFFKSNFWHFLGHKYRFGNGKWCCHWFKRYMFTIKIQTEGLKTIWDDSLELTLVTIPSGEQGTPLKPLQMAAIQCPQKSWDTCIFAHWIL